MHSPPDPPLILSTLDFVTNEKKHRGISNGLLVKSEGSDFNYYLYMFYPTCNTLWIIKAGLDSIYELHLTIP